MVSGLTFSSLISFAFFGYNVREYFYLILLHVALHWFQHHILRNWLFSSLYSCFFVGLPLWLSGKESACNARATGDTGLIPGSLGPGRSPGEGYGNPLQYSCLENPMDRGVWWVTVHGVAKSQTRLKRLSIYMHARLLCQRLTDHKCIDLFLNDLFCFIDLCVCFCANTIMFRLL